MALQEWVKKNRAEIQNNGIQRGGKNVMYTSAIEALGKIGQFWNSGENIYESEWDICLILDACRPDLMREVADNYNWLNSIQTKTSLASCSHEWMDRTFTDQYCSEISDTIYISGNPFTEGHINKGEFRDVQESWKTNWDSKIGTIHPQPLTNRTIRSWRSHKPERLIVHYMQPHYPFIESDFSQTMNLNTDEIPTGEKRKDPWDLLREGRLSKTKLWEAYQTNLQYVLDDVERIIHSVDAEIVITSDHANALGEWGIYGHPPGIPTKAVKEVPWVTVSAEHTREYDLNEQEHHSYDGDVESRLESLGYL